jgi:predicted Rossmann fold flavoprotein
VAVIGGGAAGYFAAIACAETNPQAQVVLFEKSAGVLRKVRISGGGRCNVTHACFDPREFVTRFPRGRRELLGPLHAWRVEDTISWFERRGVPLKVEADGRMFPTTDSSATVIDCLGTAARNLEVEVRTGAPVRAVSGSGADRFDLSVAQDGRFHTHRVIVASGGGEQSGGLKIAAALGHTITELAPSLFTFHIDDPRIRGLQGLSVPDVRVSCDEVQLEQAGPLLITHRGMSGPAILKLSAWGARELASVDYRCDLRINWCGGQSIESVRDTLERSRRELARKAVHTICPLDVPKRLWIRLTEAAGLVAGTQWAQVSRHLINALAEQLADSRFRVRGKSMNKEEFVTCGGVALPEIDFRRMESKLVPGLHFAGEVLDIDGVTGGFNFQAAWTTGRIAGVAAADPAVVPG